MFAHSSILQDHPRLLQPVGKVLHWSFTFIRGTFLMVEILGIVLLIFRFILADFNKIIDDLKFKIQQKDPVVAFFRNDAKHFYFLSIAAQTH